MAMMYPNMNFKIFSECAIYYNSAFCFSVHSLYYAHNIFLDFKPSHDSPDKCPKHTINMKVDWFKLKEMSCKMLKLGFCCSSVLIYF